MFQIYAKQRNESEAAAAAAATAATAAIVIDMFVNLVRIECYTYFIVHISNAILAVLFSVLIAYLMTRDVATT